MPGTAADQRQSVARHRAEAGLPREDLAPASTGDRRGTSPPAARSRRDPGRRAPGRPAAGSSLGDRADIGRAVGAREQLRASAPRRCARGIRGTPPRPVLRCRCRTRGCGPSARTPAAAAANRAARIDHGPIAIDDGVARDRRRRRLSTPVTRPPSCMSPVTRPCRNVAPRASAARIIAAVKWPGWTCAVRLGRAERLADRHFRRQPRQSWTPGWRSRIPGADEAAIGVEPAIAPFVVDIAPPVRHAGRSCAARAGRAASRRTSRAPETRPTCPRRRRRGRCFRPPSPERRAG